MYVTRLSIENVRGFLDGDAKTDIEVGAGGPGWHVFAGRNGAGKSTLLRAIALTIAGPDHARALMPSFAGWIRGDAEVARVVAKLSRWEERFSDNDDVVQGQGPFPKVPFEAGLTWTSGSGREPVLAARPERQKKPLGAAWRGPWNENPRGWLAAGYGPFRRLTGHAADARAMMAGPPHQRRLVSLFREDASLVEAVEWIRQLQFRALEKRDGADDRLEEILALLNDGLLPDGARVAKVDSEGLWVARGNNTIELHELSDGYRVALALVVDLVRLMNDAYGFCSIGEEAGRVGINQPGVVLIDEVDAHLHVSWQQRIGFWLTERFPFVQFLVTTHSPFVCQAAVPGGLFRMPSPGEQRGVEAVDEDTYRRVVNGTVDDAVLSSLFGMERTRSPRAEKLAEEWSRLRAKQSRKALSKTERARFDDLSAQLALPFERQAAE